MPFFFLRILPSCSPSYHLPIVIAVCYICTLLLLFLLWQLFRLSCLYNSWLSNKITCHLKSHNVILFQLPCIPLAFHAQLESARGAFSVAQQRVSSVRFNMSGKGTKTNGLRVSGLVAFFQSFGSQRALDYPRYFQELAREMKRTHMETVAPEGKKVPIKC